MFFRPGCAEQSISAARSTRGVSTIVAFGFIPATIHEDTLTLIRLLEQERGGANSTDMRPFQPGTRVRLREQGLQALEGLVVAVSAQRVRLLLGILGRPTEVAVQRTVNSN